MNPEYLFSGLAGEVGEVASLYAKAVRDTEGDIALDKLEKELGDVLWFVATIASYHGLNIDNIMERNIEKLLSRQARQTLQGSGDDR